jgi:hypothetical protein
MTARQKLFAAALAVALPLGAFAQAPAAPAEPAEKPATPPPEKKAAEETVKVTPYGFIQLSGFWDDSTFAAKDYPGQVAAVQEGGSFLMSARYSRFGVRLATKDTAVTHADITGVIEFDFKAGHLPTSASACTGTTCTITGANTPSTSWYNGLMRLRLAAMTASWKGDWGGFSLLAGQEYGLVNPLFAESITWTADPLFWMAGNLWRRSPQIRATLTPKLGNAFGLILQGAVLSPADSNTPVDFGAGNRSRRPDLEGRVALTGKMSPDVNGTVGFGYHTNERRYTAGEKDITVDGYGADAEINVPYLGLKGEWYSQSGLDDTYNGIIGTPVGGTAGSRRKVDTNGFWGQAVVKFVPALWATVGYGEAHADKGDLGAAFPAAAGTANRTNNTQIEAGLICNAGKFWRFGVEWMQTKTRYASNLEQKGNQYALSSQLKF